MKKDSTKGLSKVIRIDESEIRGHLESPRVLRRLQLLRE
jgi:hypothetical protein